MTRDRSDETADPAIDEPAGDETVVAGPRAKKKAKFLASDSGLKTAIYQSEQHGERPATVPEGTDEIALEQPEVTDTEIEADITLDPSQRARVLDVHDKAARLLAELDVTANHRSGDRLPSVDPTAPTQPITEEQERAIETADLDPEPFDDGDDYDYDDSLDEGETVVDPRAISKPAYPTPMPGEPPAHTPTPGSISHRPLDADELDDGIGIETIETGWSPDRPADPAPPGPVAPRPMAPPERRTVGSVLLAPFRALASLFRPRQPDAGASQPGMPPIGEPGNLQTYTEVNRMVQKRRKPPSSSPPPPHGGDDER